MAAGCRPSRAVATSVAQPEVIPCASFTLPTWMSRVRVPSRAPALRSALGRWGPGRYVSPVDPGGADDEVVGCDGTRLLLWRDPPTAPRPAVIIRLPPAEAAGPTARPRPHTPRADRRSLGRVSRRRLGAHRRGRRPGRAQPEEDRRRDRRANLRAAALDTTKTVQAGGAHTDLAVVRIDGDPGLPRLRVPRAHDAGRRHAARARRQRAAAGEPARLLERVGAARARAGPGRPVRLRLAQDAGGQDERRGVGHEPGGVAGRVGARPRRRAHARLRDAVP
ncbi:MAG: hypothetical protein MZV70_45380 [Desulfobacterales bacterium]|nr:hypothetical protein [Desulfobacterales bacterium]